MRNLSKERHGDDGPALRLLCWEGYDQPELLDPFLRQFATRVTTETLLSDYDAALRIVRDPGRWDVANLNNPFARDFLDPRAMARAPDRAPFDPSFPDML